MRYMTIHEHKPLKTIKTEYGSIDRCICGAEKPTVSRHWLKEKLCYSPAEYGITVEEFLQQNKMKEAAKIKHNTVEPEARRTFKNPYLSDKR